LELWRERTLRLCEGVNTGSSQLTHENIYDLGLFGKGLYSGKKNGGKSKRPATKWDW
jgi:hypothetical protein